METLATMDPRSMLVKLARQSSAAWLALGEWAFAGDIAVETKNTLYLFHNGIFVSRARRPTRTSESPQSMRGIRLIGFYADQGKGLWVLSPEWDEGMLAVMWRPGGLDEQSFLLTSATSDFSLTEPAPRTCRARATAPSSSDIFRRPISRPPALRRPAPPSMTRVMPFLPGELTSLTT